MLHLFLRHFGLIMVWGLLVGAAAGAGTFLFPQYYTAESQVLIISRDRSGVDPYTQAKSAERIGENLAELMSTTDFFDKVMQAEVAGFDRRVWLTLGEREQRKRWEKNVIGSVVFGASLLNITVYERSPSAALALSEAVTKTMVTRGWEYVGGDVAIKQVDSSLVSRFPARPNALLNTAVGFFVGALLAAMWVARYRQGRVFGKI